jgi:hypothetical protein
MNSGVTSGKRASVVSGGAFGLGFICLVVVSFLPPHKGQFLDDPVRCFLSGLGVIGVATPLCVTGAALKRKFSQSPYFEGGFIAGVLNLFGSVLVATGLVCIGFGIYDLIKPLLEKR